MDVGSGSPPNTDFKLYIPSLQVISKAYFWLNVYTINYLK